MPRQKSHLQPCGLFQTNLHLYLLILPSGVSFWFTQLEASASESATSTAFESGDLLVTYTNIARKQAMLHEISLMDASLNAHDEL